MENHIAVIGLQNVTEGFTALAQALATAGVRATQCPLTEPRSILRWTMDLSPDETMACVFVDPDGHLAASLTTALDPAIPSIVWCRSPSHPERLAQILSATPVLVSFATSEETFVQTLKSLIMPPVSHAITPLAVDRPASPAVVDVQTLPAAYEPPNPTPPSPPPTTEPSEEDAAIYEQLESMMAVSLHTPLPPRQPVVIQTPGLDFSLPLRHLMSAARSLAQNASQPEVQSIHYIAAVEEPYATAFARAGLDLATLRSTLKSEHNSASPATEPLVSDEVFEGVNRAKSRARQLNAPATRVADFLTALLDQPANSLVSALATHHVSHHALLEALAEIDPSQEATSEPFFKPSSLDQSGFYQFDSSQVQDVADRLKHLPAYKKAAARVAETRPKMPAGSPPQNIPSAPAAPPQPSAPPMPEPPPEKPEIFNVTGEFPSVDVIEQVSDLLLEGQIVAFPADTMLALAVDAANPAAIANLRETAAIDPGKPLSILINSTSQLKHLVKADLDAMEPLFDELWPGPLTLVFSSMSGAGRHVSWKKTIAVRQPSDNVSLAVLSMLGRPLAVTSWDHDLEKLHGTVAAIIKTSAPPEPIQTTIIDVSQSPWRVLRQGAVPAEEVLQHQK